MKKIRLGSKLTMLISLVFIIALLLPGTPVAQAKHSADDWSLEYDYLRHKIVYDDGVTAGGCGMKCIYPYLKALDRLAKYRDEAHSWAMEANAEGNSYYYDKFLGLEQLAQGGADLVLYQVCYIFFDLPDREEKCGLDWANICLTAEVIEPIYDKAKELKFDYAYMQAYVGFWLDDAIGQVAFGYCDMPGLCWCCECPGVRGKDCATPDVDQFLLMVEEGGVRRVAKYYDLGSLYEKMTNIMDKCLQDALCVLDKGHQWYIDLADQYGLTRAKGYIEGFYGTLYGKVEVENEDGKREPAVGAKVTVTDPHDGRTWTATADAKGNYEIEKVILHTKCSPFDISAEYKGDSVQTTYDGPLAEPNPSARFEKNLVIKKESGWLLEFTYTASCPAGYATRTSNQPYPGSKEEVWETETYSITVKALLKPTKLESYMACPYTATAYECWTAQVKMESHHSRERKWHWFGDYDCPAENTSHSESWSMQYAGDLPVHLVLTSWPDPVSSAKNARLYLIGFYGKPGEPDNWDYGVPIPFSYTSRDTCDVPPEDRDDCRHLFCTDRNSAGTVGISDGLYFLPTLVFPAYAIMYGTPSMLGEGGDSRSVTWSYHTDVVYNPAMPIFASRADCGLEGGLAFEPGQDFYTNHLEWTLTKLGEE